MQKGLGSLVFSFLILLIACSINENSHQDSNNVETKTTSENKEDVELMISATVSLEDVLDDI